MNSSPSSLLDSLTVASAVVFWVAAYVLMVRRGFKDRSYGIPLTALCVNIPWEVFYAFVADTTPLAKGVSLAYLVPDVLVLWTCLKFGPDDFDSPLLKHGFPYLAAAGMAAGAAAIWGLHVALPDQFGATTASFTTGISALTFFAMLLRRNSVRGQSIYIGVCLVLGNLAGWRQTVLAQHAIQPNIPLLWVHIAYTVIVSAGVAYLAVFLHVCRRDGVNPWSRW